MDHVQAFGGAFLISILAVIVSLFVVPAVHAQEVFNNYDPQNTNCAQFTAFNAAAGLTGSDLTNYEKLICGGVSDGWLVKLDGFWVLAAPILGVAAINLANPGTYNLVSLSCENVFVANNGCQNGVLANTGYNPSQGTNYSVNSASVGIWMHYPADEAVPVYAVAGITGLNLYSCYVDDRIYPRLNDVSPAESAYGCTGPPTGLMTQVRSSSTQRDLYINTLGSVASWSQAVTSVPDAILYLGGDGANTANVPFINAAFVGGALTATDVLNVYTRLNTFFTAQGCGNC